MPLPTSHNFLNCTIFLICCQVTLDFGGHQIYNISKIESKYQGKVQQMSVILIGMPSCGKSTLGVLLAKKLGYRFIDSDLLIQEREGMLLHDIIESKGIDGFLAIENEVNASITDTRAVISTGGSAVYGKEAMEHLRTLGSVVYLNISCDTMVSRLGDYVHRGVVLPEGYTLEDMYRERSVLYESYADITVHTDSGDISTALEEISSVLVKKDKIRETP